MYNFINNGQLSVPIRILYSIVRARAGHEVKIVVEVNFKILFISQNKDINHFIFKVYRDLH